MKNHTQSTVRVADIPAIIDDPARGIISLVGDYGGISLITGDIETSGLVPGTLAIETEHGTIHLEPDEDTLISEEMPFCEDPEWHVAWSIDGHGSSPEQAAATVWKQHFSRTMAGGDDACVFIVTDPGTNQSVTVDLSEFDLASLID